MCHEADLHSRTAGRSKIKVDDFQFALRHDARKLGRIVELLEVNRQIQKKRSMFKQAGNQAPGTSGAAQAGTGDADDDEMRELAELLESGRTKKGKAKALRDVAAAAAARKDKLMNEDAMEGIEGGLDVDEME
jgi:transcription initiation factor TFIID subunit 13